MKIKEDSSEESRAKIHMYVYTRSLERSRLKTERLSYGGVTVIQEVKYCISVWPSPLVKRFWVGLGVVVSSLPFLQGEPSKLDDPLASQVSVCTQ